MKIYVTDRNKISKYILPNVVEGVFLFPYKEPGSKVEKSINIEASDGSWILKENNHIGIIQNNNISSSIKLEDNLHVQLLLHESNQYIDLYCLPSYEETAYRYNVNTEEIFIGKTQDCGLIINSEYIEAKHCQIVRTNNKWYITAVYNPNLNGSLVYLNDKVITKTVPIKAGDSIFLNGIKIIFMIGFIQISNKVSSVSVNPRILQLRGDDGINNEQYDPLNEEQQNVELYKQEDYFFHTPSLKKNIDTKIITIDEPPASENKQSSALVSIGSSLTMLASSFATGFSIITNIQNGTPTKRLIPQIVTFFAMLIGSLIIPKVAKFFEDRAIKKREEYRINKYSAYLVDKQQEISNELNNQIEILNRNYPPLQTCLTYLDDMNYTWTREIKDEDFLNIRLGTGTKEADLVIKTAEEHFTLYDDELYKKIYDIVNCSKMINNIPICYSMVENRISAFINNTDYKDDILKSLFTQIVTYHSAGDLKIIFLNNKNNDFDLSFGKFLPHSFSPDKMVRYYSDNVDEMKTLSSELVKIYDERLELIKKENQEKEGLVSEEKMEQNDYRKFPIYYLIVTNDYMNAKNLPIIEKIQSSETNYGFSLFILDTSIKKLPNKCKAFVSIGDKEGTLIEKNTNTRTGFIPDVLTNIDMRFIGRKLLNIPIQEQDVESTLPSSLTFLDMFNVSKIEQLNIQNRWRTSDPTTSLSTPIGVHTSGETFMLDLHEKKHGPHGLIAGSTGSGKSEFIITFILSMCVSYHPDEVQFVLIDYKGGGLTGAFENPELGRKVPHIAGSITNLDVSEINRSLVSINSELKRRQKVFNDAKTITGESTLDIYKYQKFYRDGLVKEPVSHLFIISDEFAELKAQQPEFMDELVSTARIGRSLGVHLILATQKPSGVVNEQIWSNSKFKICLKVATKGDSMEMLKRPEAASLKETGRFYLQIGYDEYFDIGQSGWSGAKYIPSDQLIKTRDKSIKFVDNVGSVIKVAEISEKVKDVQDIGDQLTNITKLLSEIAVKENYQVRKLWLDKIPEVVYLGNIKQKYNHKPTPYVICPVIGEYDAPEDQKQDILTLDLSNKGNTIIYGANGNGQENLLSTIIYSTAIDHSPEEVNFYVVDLGAETLKIFNKMPHVSDICTIESPDKINNLFGMLDTELDKRKELFSDYNGDYNYYISKSGNKLPLLVTIINNYDTFAESFSKLNELLASFYRECAKYGIVFVVTCNTQTTIRSKVSEYFLNKMCLKMGKDEDYRNILNAKKGLIPNNNMGRGIIQMDKNCYEFQSAYIFVQDKINETIKDISLQLTNMYPNYKPKRIPVLPNVVTLDLLDSEVKSVNMQPVGFEINSKTICTYDFTKDKFNVICGTDIEEIVSFVRPMACLFNETPDVEFKVFDFIKILSLKRNPFKIINKEMELEIADLIQEVKQQDNERVYVMLAFSVLKDVISKELFVEFGNTMKEIKNNPKVHFIVVEDIDNIKRLQLESWFNDNVNKSNGIWIGQGIGNQGFFTIKNLAPDIKSLNFSDMAISSCGKTINVFRKVVIKDEEE